MSLCEKRVVMSLGGKCRALAVLLLSGIALATANASKAEAAGRDGDPVPATVVLRGSTPEMSQPPAVPDSAPVVLRGSPPPHPPPHTALPACPPGYDYDPSAGCIAPGDAYAPDYGYWPAYGLGWFGFDGQRHAFRRGFSHHSVGRRAIRLGRHGGGPSRSGHGFAHAAEFGQRSAARAR
jgi:hypothetical protein